MRSRRWPDSRRPRVARRRIPAIRCTPSLAARRRSSTSPGRCWSLPFGHFSGGGDGVVVELADAVGLRPDADFARHRLRERVFEQELVVEVAAQLRPAHSDLHPVPLAELQRHVVRALLHEAALSLLEGPEHEVVLLAVEADRQVIAVRFQVEEDAGALIELAAEEAEAHRDL